MAAIDKIYVNSWNEYQLFKEWCETQPTIKDKYGKDSKIIDYFFYQWNNQKYWNEKDCHPVMSAPFYIDAYIIRNCPFDFIQENLMINYGYRSQEHLKEAYEIVKNRKPEIQKQIDDAKGEYPKWSDGVEFKDISYWYWNLDDFIIDEIGFITIKNDEKSDYELIKDGLLYDKPYIDKYERGKHFKMIKKPSFYYGNLCQRPIRGCWMVNVKLPDYVDELYMVWHSHSKTRFSVGTWDFAGEFVESTDGWSSSATYCRTIDALKRRIPKWNLPVGTIVVASGCYMGEIYEFIVKK